MRSARALIGCGVALACCIQPGPAAAESESKSVRVSATILPRLELSITPETGESIAFGAIEQPATGEATSRSVKVSVNVFSNLASPYHVTQLIRKPLTNPEGVAIAENQFLVTTRDATHGRGGAPQPTPIAPGTSTTLYTSNARGKSDTFSTDYTLVVTPQTPAGDFDTEIVYTVTSL